jgi:hypothetical protein
MIGLYLYALRWLGEEEPDRSAAAESPVEPAPAAN